MTDASTNEIDDELWADIVAANVMINALAGTVCNTLINEAPTAKIAALIALLSARMMLEYAEDLAEIDKPAKEVLAELYEAVRDAVRNDACEPALTLQ
jgi:hypothetical protein